MVVLGWPCNVKVVAPANSVTVRSAHIAHHRSGRKTVAAYLGRWESMIAKS